MRFASRGVAALFFCLALCCLSIHLCGQDAQSAQPASISVYPAGSDLPNAPEPQVAIAYPGPQSAPAQSQQQPEPVQSQTNTSQSGNSQQPAPSSGVPALSQAPTSQNDSTQSSSSQQNSAQSPDTQESKHQKAEEQIREQEHQRIAGIVPSFNVSYRSDAVSLTAAEKFKLQFRAAIDPYTFAIAAITAGLGEAEDSNTGFSWGPGGYGERWAAAYGDNVIGNTLGNALLPSILHQDPRYFRLGHGTVRHRLLYAFATSFICKHDNTGKWEPNYSNVLGNMIAGEISTLYYPNSKGDATQAIETGLTVTFEGTFGAELQEFWPDISRRFFHKDPTHGLDAQLRAAERKKNSSGDDLPATSGNPPTTSNAPPAPAPAPPAPAPAAKYL
jgi:hypothetical protein